MTKTKQRTNEEDKMKIADLSIMLVDRGTLFSH